MSKNLDNEIKTMQRLINYGTDNKVNENKSTGTVVEYQTKAADGKTYGIIRECNKFYIKVAPKKDTEVLAEDFDYIGGFNNKRFNEYGTYTMASKQLDLKLKSINEACNSKIETSQFNKQEASEWQINETKEMRQDIDRFYELMNNVSTILKEESKHKPLEAPGSASVSDKDVSAPFEVPATASGHKEVNSKEVNHEKSGIPYDNQPKVDMQSDKMPKTPGDNGIPYDKKPIFGPGHKLKASDAVADKNPGGGKVTHVNEGKSRTVKLTEEQVLAWSKNKDYMDKSHGTEIGHGGDPFDEEVHPEKENDRNINTEYHVNEEVAMHATDNQNKPTPGTGDAQSKPEPFDDKVDTVYEMTQNGDEQMLTDEYDIELDLGDDPDAAAGRDPILNDPNFGHETIDTLFDDEDEYVDFPLESRRRGGRRVNEEMVLHDFGKHPAYQKQVMTLPPNKEIDRWGRDWNDDSAKGEEPFGKKIGSSAPFTEKVVDMITDAVMERFTKKKD